MSIVRVGLSESDGFDEGYDAIFGKKKENETKDESAQSQSQEQSTSAKKETKTAKKK